MKMQGKEKIWGIWPEWQGTASKRQDFENLAKIA